MFTPHLPKYRYVCLPLVLQALVTTPAKANDFSVGGSGADLVPLEETRVRMESEAISMVFRDGSFSVAADYTFVNASADSITMQVGFPEIHCPSDVDCNARFWDLTTTVGDKPVVHRKGRLTTSHAWSQHIGRVWVFDVTFPPSRATKIRHTYRTTAGGSVDQNATFTYVTRTGAIWAGDIGHATFVMQLPPEVHTVSNTMGKPSFVGVGSSSPHVELRLERRNWSPINDVHVNFHFAPLLAPHNTQHLTSNDMPSANACPLPKMPSTPEQTQTCKNLVYAISGYAFEKPHLRNYFYGGKKGWRLTRAPHFDPPAEAPTVWTRGLQEFPGYDAVANMPATNRQFLAYLDEASNAQVSPLTNRAPDIPASTSASAVSHAITEASAPESQRIEPTADVSERSVSTERSVTTERSVSGRAVAASRSSNCNCTVPKRQLQRQSWVGLLMLACSTFARRFWGRAGRTR